MIHDDTMTESDREDASMLAAENRVLRGNLLALKRMLLFSFADGEKEHEEDGDDKGSSSREPPLRRRRMTEEEQEEEGRGERRECLECQKLQRTLRNALDQYKTVMNERDALEKELLERKAEIEKLKRESEGQRRSAEEREIQKLIAAAATKKRKDFERRNRQKFVPFCVSFSFLFTFFTFVW